MVGISGDAVQTLAYFQQANHLNFTLLSDVNGDIARLFGVPTRKGGAITRTIDGKEVILKRATSTARWTFILDKTGKVVYKNEKVKVSEDKQQVLDFIKKKTY